MKPIYALHKDAGGQIIDAGAFSYSHNLNDWFRNLDVRGGDTIEFGEKAARSVELPETLLKQPEPIQSATSDAKTDADEDLTF